MKPIKEHALYVSPTDGVVKRVWVTYAFTCTPINIGYFWVYDLTLFCQNVPKLWYNRLYNSLDDRESVFFIFAYDTNRENKTP
jgi:hypothetical protein